MNKLLQEGTKNLEAAFRDLLQEGNEKPIVPLEYVLKSEWDWNKSPGYRPLTLHRKAVPCVFRGETIGTAHDQHTRTLHLYTSI